MLTPTAADDNYVWIDRLSIYRYFVLAPLELIRTKLICCGRRTRLVKMKDSREGRAVVTVKIHPKIRFCRSRV
jgi:hypothetical protein